MERSGICGYCSCGRTYAPAEITRRFYAASLLGAPMVEPVFEDVVDFAVTEAGTDLLHAELCERDGKIVWARKDGHEAYVVASKLKWRILSDEATL